MNAVKLCLALLLSIVCLATANNFAFPARAAAIAKLREAYFTSSYAEAIRDNPRLFADAAIETIYGGGRDCDCDPVIDKRRELYECGMYVVLPNACFVDCVLPKHKTGANRCKKRFLSWLTYNREVLNLFIDYASQQ